ncbi:MAG: hypothetical protein EOO32_00675 [Comamonadaceae bacterium]|nr:MAG: hypothetical protein EOO32_00675 [Comamonadaceae bacterium]
MNWTIALSVLAAIVLVWCLIPSLWVLTLPGVPIEHRRAAAQSFGRASLRGLIILPADILAPLVVPFALLGCKWESENLPRWARWWDNDVNLNGDAGLTWSRNPVTGLDGPDPVPLEDTPEVRGLCYWLTGHHPRSFLARWMWIGFRNRASALAVSLGHPADYSKPVQEWGDPPISREREGWHLTEHNGAYQLFATKRLGPLCWRFNYGNKVGFTWFKRPMMPVVCITFSLLAWKGKTEAAVN